MSSEQMERACLLETDPFDSFRVVTGTNPIETDPFDIFRVVTGTNPIETDPFDIFRVVTGTDPLKKSLPMSYDIHLLLRFTRIMEWICYGSVNYLGMLPLAPLPSTHIQHQSICEKL